MKNSLMLAVVSWFLPGAGYFLIGRLRRALIVAAIVWGLFIVAVLSGGAFYPGMNFEEGTLLYVLNVIARIGNGLGAVISWYVITNPPTNVEAWSIFEYGGRFLEISGLLNFLAVVDILDINAGRKE